MQELKNAKILKRELNEKALNHPYFELKNITFYKNIFPWLASKAALHRL